MIFSYLLNMQSHPSWVCGLKLKYFDTLSKATWSHPSWVCGLKLDGNVTNLGCSSHTLRGCVD